jgi:predicted histone-like DNA-binding protein
MKYKVVARGNPGKPKAPKKLYASPVNEGKYLIEDFARKNGGRSALTRLEIMNVINTFLSELPTHLKSGYSVRLGDFGTFRLNLVSDGVEDSKKFTVDKIKGTRVIFTPGLDLKESLKKIQLEEKK